MSHPSSSSRLPATAPTSSLASLSRPGTPPLSQASSDSFPLAQPNPRVATGDRMDNLERGQAALTAQLGTLVAALSESKMRLAGNARHRSGSISSASEPELDATVAYAAGHTPAPFRFLKRGKERRNTLSIRTRAVQEAAESANSDVLGLPVDRRRSLNEFMAAGQDDESDENEDESEHKVNNTHTQHQHNNEQPRKAKHVVVLKPRGDANKRLRAAAASSAAGVMLHPDLFAPAYDETEPIITLLGKSLSAGVKSRKKFADRAQLNELLMKGRQSALDADGLDEVQWFRSHTHAWLLYESYSYRLVMEKGWEAADWYHRKLFEKIQLGHHDLADDGPVDSELLRELDRQWSWLSESQLASRKMTSSSSSSQDRFRAKSSGSGGASSNNNAHKHAKQPTPFTGVPCKHHGAQARHTTAECKAPPAN